MKVHAKFPVRFAVSLLVLLLAGQPMTLSAQTSKPNIGAAHRAALVRAPPALEFRSTGRPALLLHSRRGAIGL
jgi:hypothetical protein